MSDLEVSEEVSELVVEEFGNNLAVDGAVERLLIPETTLEIVEVTKQGPEGASGSAASSHLHTQSSSSATWTVNHNLGYRPNVEVFNTGWAEVDASVVHNSVNQTVITFSQPTTGYARMI